MMQQFRQTYYPTILQAVHLLILYLFIQTVVDFPLALIDYYKGTDYLYNPIKKIILNTGSTLFILLYGFKKTKAPFPEVFPLKMFNPLILIPIITFFWSAHNLLEPVNIAVEKVVPAPPWFWELFSKVFESDYGWWGAFFKVAVIAPVIEELIFRGLILHGLRKNYNAVKAVLVSALLFSLFHLNPWQMPATFVLGVLLGWIMIRTNSILLAILGHSLNNLIVLLTITYWEQISNHAIYLIGKEEKLMLSGLVIGVSLILIYFSTLWPFKKAGKN
ncbi:CPBP family intramembrane glutamic endopeptidase [Mariniphaga sp.]|uniref:CPBP family intramembrane glutamic endopeptidase n=1 Tax=Mariniphaga sp. TaxID=1954475 RepID=UPI003568D640